MVVKTYPVQFQTRGNGQVVDVTGQINRAISDSQLKAGIVTAFVGGSTAALTTIEYEDGAVSDFQRMFEEIASENREYKHNLRWGDGNGHSHVRAALLGPSLTIPFVDRQLTLGTWQQVIFVDFDNRSRNRTVIIQVMGE